MSDPLEALILDLLEWIEARPRAHAEVIEVWRTSCPRLPVWEEANERGFVARQRDGDVDGVCVTALGREFVERHRPRRPALPRR